MLLNSNVRERMAAARLNLDVLEIISEFLTDVPDVLSFALISPSTRHAATRTLLRMGPIFLTGGESIRKFHSFLFADTPARTPHVRALDIDKGPPSRLLPAQPGDASLLIEILTSCPNIDRVSIVIRDDDPSRLTCDLCIIHAIAALQSLRSLRVDSPYATRLIPLLREVCVPLRMLSLRGCTDVTDFWYPAALDDFLPHLGPTLEKLELDEFVVETEEIKARGAILTPSVFTMTQYPAVRSLSVHSLTGQPLLDHLQHLFPALDGTLSFGMAGFQSYGGQYNYPAIRAANQRAQESSRSHPWKKLDQLVCDPMMLHVLGLRCPIRHVLLDVGLVPTQPSGVLEALRENPVPRLKLTLRHDPSMFDGVFSPELAGTLTHLTLRLMWGFQSGLSRFRDADAVRPPRWGDVLDATVTSLQPLHKLTHLRVVIQANVGHYNPDRSLADDHEPTVARAKEYVCSFRGSAFDFEATAASLVRPLASLQCIFLETHGCLANRDVSTEGFWKAYERWHVARAWRVGAPGPSEPTLVELHDEVAETIIRKEELVLSEGDESALQVYSEERR
ncbi:hypothetical protein LXA43DRAFT_1087216 [Ganoderma leucocontextum]|nr:hypothetical protein LXA43DRAFT_1087216 [Ganoderma leucocontextum]